MAITLFGISQCDSVKKTKQWFDSHQIQYVFQDLKKEPISAELLNTACEQLTWQKILNKRSTTYRQLPDELKNNLNESTVITTLLNHPTLIKRPLIKCNNTFLVGFDPNAYQLHFTAKE